MKNSKISLWIGESQKFLRLQKIKIIKEIMIFIPSKF